MKSKPRCEPPCTAPATHRLGDRKYCCKCFDVVIEHSGNIRSDFFPALEPWNAPILRSADYVELIDRQKKQRMARQILAQFLNRGERKCRKEKSNA